MIVWLMIGALVGVGVVLGAVWHNHPFRAGRRAIATALSLDVHGPVLSATRDRFRISVAHPPGVWARALGFESSHTVVRVDGGHAIPLALTIVSAHAGARRRPSAHTGDALFDGNVHIEGDRDEVLALCDDVTRERILEIVVGHGGHIRHGVLTLTQWGLIRRPGRAQYVIERLLALARRLTLVEAQLPNRLAWNARSDRDPQVKRENLLALLIRFPQHPDAQALAAGALGDDDARIVLAAARVIGKPAVPQVIAMVSDSASGHAQRCGGFDFLLEKAPADALAPVAFRLFHHADPAILTRVARALVRVGTPDARQALRQLAAADHAEVQIAAVTGLGLCGGRDDVGVLRDIEASAGGPVRDAAKRAVARIHGRLDAGGVGGLSLVAPNEETAPAEASE